MYLWDRLAGMMLFVYNNINKINTDGRNSC